MNSILDKVNLSFCILDADSRNKSVEKLIDSSRTVTVESNKASTLWLSRRRRPAHEPSSIIVTETSTETPSFCSAAINSDFNDSSKSVLLKGHVTSMLDIA